MISGPKYKIARRLGANIFEKTQTQKFALRQERKGGKPSFRPKGDYALAMLEKQKVRFSYGVGERQFKKYVNESLAKKGATVQALFERLETRLDNVVYRLGLASTRQAARQMTAHGHILVNGKRTNVPSQTISMGDKVSIRLASQKKPLFATVDEKMKKVALPSWISYDADKKTATVEGMPKYAQKDHLFNLGQVIEFYSR
ncbi:MAG TPA: 30S ribosomal protein S4 [Candidatus Paceibacterota bacterium]